MNSLQPSTVQIVKRVRFIYRPTRYTKGNIVMYQRKEKKMGIEYKADVMMGKRVVAKCLKIPRKRRRRWFEWVSKAQNKCLEK